MQCLLDVFGMKGCSVKLKRSWEGSFEIGVGFWGSEL